MSALGQKRTCAPQKTDVRFSPNSDRESESTQTVMSALPPKADMYGAVHYVMSALGTKRTLTASCLNQFLFVVVKPLRRQLPLLRFPRQTLVQVAQSGFFSDNP